jgi:S-adenosyl methyltransferase
VSKHVLTGPGRTGLAVSSPARIYSYLLGGGDYYATDQAAAESALSAVLNAPSIARANRRFVARAVRCMAGQGIGQFIDLGSGLPARPAVHHIAHSVVPSARVLYVDNDPSVTGRHRSRSTPCEGIGVIHGDIREPHKIFASRHLEHLIDFGQPLGLLLAAVLHFIPPEDDPEIAVRAFTRYLAPGSCLAVSHATSDGTHPSVVAAIEDAYKTASAPVVFRTADQIRGFFDGLSLVSPGLADMMSWPGPMPVPAPAGRCGCWPASPAARHRVRGDKAWVAGQLPSTSSMEAVHR